MGFDETGSRPEAQSSTNVSSTFKTSLNYGDVKEARDWMDQARQCGGTNVDLTPCSFVFGDSKAEQSGKETDEKTPERPDGKEKGAEKLTGEKLFDKANIKRIVRVKEDGSDGEEIKLKDGQKLAPGDYEIEFDTPKDASDKGRCFRVHIPEGEPKGVMMLIPGCSNKDQDPRGYIPESKMDEQAKGQKGEPPLIVVTALTEKHKLGTDSTVAAWGWNLPGALIPEKDVKAHAEKVGYDDRDYFAGLLNVVPQLTDAPSDYAKWGYLAGSQGAAALHRLVGDDRFKGKIQNIYVAGGTMEAGDHEMGFVKKPEDEKYMVTPYKVDEQNGKRVIVIDTAGDKTVLPHKDNAVSQFALDVARSVKLKGIGLDAFDPRHQDPEKQVKTYMRIGDKAVPVYRRLGDSEEYLVKAYVAGKADKNLKTSEDFDTEITSEKALNSARANKQDIRWTYVAKKLGVSIDEYELPTAAHVIPGPREGSTSTDKTKKYEGLYSARIAASDLRERIKKREKTAP